MPAHPVYFTYIVKCIDGSYYTGWTNDLLKRIKQHNGELSGGARYTRSRRPVTLVSVEEYGTPSEAMQREIAIKNLTHKEKEQLCHS